MRLERWAGPVYAASAKAWWGSLGGKPLKHFALEVVGIDGAMDPIV